MNPSRFGGQKPTLATGDLAKDERATLLRSARRIVFKLGTNVVAESEGNLCVSRLAPWLLPLPS